jgi:hypothetical protein
MVLKDAAAVVFMVLTVASGVILIQKEKKKENKIRISNQLGISSAINLINI